MYAKYNGFIKIYDPTNGQNHRCQFDVVQPTISKDLVEKWYHELNDHNNIDEID